MTATVEDLRRQCEAAGKQVAPAGLVDEPTTAWLLGLPARTLRDMRRRGMGPCVSFVGGKRVRYQLSDIEDYLTQISQRPRSRACASGRK